MKIARIREIKNIGTFSDFNNGSSIEFEKLTFIYGYNTYWKTTLTDIFQSLKDNDPKIIQDRKTIPELTWNQKATFSIKETTESNINYDRNVWSQNEVASNLEVFGTDFIHRNLFTGLTIERANKENFTQFVLWEQWVAKAELIAQKKKTYWERKRDLPNKLPLFVKWKPEAEINSFLNFSITGLDKDEIINLLANKRIELQTQEERLREPQKILWITEPSVYNSQMIDTKIWDFLNLLEGINKILDTDYSGIKDEILWKLEEHFHTNFANHNNTESWIKKWLEFSQDKENCPFCWQSLTNATDLIGVYNSYFDIGFNQYIERIQWAIKSYRENSLMATWEFWEKTKLQTALSRIEQFKALIQKKEFQDKLTQLFSEIEALDETTISNLKASLFNQFRTALEEKSQYPHKKIEIINFSEIKTFLLSYSTSINSIKPLIDELLIEIGSFKAQYEDTSIIQQSIQSIKLEIQQLDYKKARIEQDINCMVYWAEKQANQNLEREIQTEETDLHTNQSQYLESYFTEINTLFKKFWSNNFTLERELNSQWHLPVYSLKIKFHWIEIPNNKLQATFSESDRRALALSIFWAKINLKTIEEKQKLIVVLDDPITSFDDNRITITINYIKEIIDWIEQVIVLTHYPIFINRFCEIIRNIPTKFIQINRNSTTSLLALTSKEEFMMSSYERVFIKIYWFINRTHNENIKTDLRPFFENLYLPTVFAKTIKDKNIDLSSLSLEEKINWIFDDEETKTKMNSFRTTLNPDSHIFTSNNDEDVLNFASDMINYLYSVELK